MGYEIKSQAMYDHFVSAATVLDQLAKLHNSPWDQRAVSRRVRRLCRSPDIVGDGSLHENDVRSKVVRLLEQHAREWEAFKEGLGNSSFLAQLLDKGVA